MSLVGVRLLLMMGPTVAVPVPPELSLALRSASVTHADQGPSAAQLVFHAGRRGGPAAEPDPAVLRSPLIRTGSRVVLTVVRDGLPRVLFDGLVTQRQFDPGVQPGTATLAVTAEDVRVAMDLEEKVVEHPAQDETIIALKVIASYARYGLVPLVVPPPAIDVPLPTDRIPVQRATDLRYLEALAARHGYVFAIFPGPAPLANLAYWGPPVRVGVPQPALTLGMGGAGNLESLSFSYRGLAPTLVAGEVQDRLTNQAFPVRTFLPTRPPLGAVPAVAEAFPTVRTSLLRGAEGLSVAQAYARAQAQTDASSDGVAGASGRVDLARYRGSLEPRTLVTVRGAGWTHDGLWYVQRVTHSIEDGRYGQEFALTRAGIGAVSPVVPV